MAPSILVVVGWVVSGWARLACGWLVVPRMWRVVVLVGVLIWWVVSSSRFLLLISIFGGVGNGWVYYTTLYYMQVYYITHMC